MADEKKIIEIKVELTDGVKEIGRLISMIDTLNKEQKSNTKVTDEQKNKYAENTVALKEYRAQLSTLVRETRNEIKSTSEKLGYIQQLKAQVSNLTLEYERLTQAELQGEKGAQVLSNLKSKREELSKLEQAYGNYTRNVGNYSSATNMLAINLGQVMKEIPNFAISARIGIMSLTNNLPMLAEAIKAVRIEQQQMVAAGKAVPSMFSLITKSVFGLTGIVSIAMVALQVFGGQIVEWAKNAIIGETAADRLTAANERLNNSYENSKRIMNEKIEIMRLMGGEESEIITQQINESNKRFLDNEGRELAGLKNDLAIGKKLSKQRKERYEELRKLEIEHGNEIADLQSKYRIALQKEEVEGNKKAIEEQKKNQKEKEKLALEFFNKQYEALQEQNQVISDIQSSQFEVSKSILKNGEKAIDDFYNRAKNSITDIRGLMASVNKQMSDQATQDSNSWSEEQRKKNQDAIYYADLELATLEAKNQSTLQARLRLLDAEKNAEINNAYETWRSIDEINAFYAAKREQIKREETKAMISSTVDLLGAIASLWGENTTEYKVFATAQAVMNTWLGVTNALANTKGGIVAQIAGVGTALLTGFAAVKKIWAVKVDSPNQSTGGSINTATQSQALPPDLTSRMAQPVGGIINPSNSSAITTGAATSISTGAADQLRIMQNMPAPIVTVKDIEVAQKRVKVIDSISKV